MKVFISYSRLDSDLGEAAYNYLYTMGYEVFIDKEKIGVGADWENDIKEHISNCDIFVVIITPSSIVREQVKKEVELAKDKEKTIIPCITKGIERQEIPWELNKYNQITFELSHELGRTLYQMIKRTEKTNNKKENYIVPKTEVIFKSLNEKQDNLPPKIIQQADISKDINTLINNGNILYDQGKYGEAIEWYNEVLKIDPNNQSISYKKFQAIEHLPKASFKTYYNKKITAKALSEELVSYLQQKNFTVICKSDHQNNTYFITAFITASNLNKLTKTNKITLKLKNILDDINIKVRGYSSNLEIFLSIGEFKKSPLNIVGTAISSLQLYGIPIVFTVLDNYNKKKFKREIWKLIEKRVS